MLFQRINRTDAEKVFSVLYNVSGATVSQGENTVFDSGASIDGVRVTTPATTSLSLIAGVAAEAIVDSAYGKVQVYGYNTQVYVTNNTSVAIVLGDILVPQDATRRLARSAASDGLRAIYVIAEAFATATTPAAAQKKVFIKAL